MRKPQTSRRSSGAPAFTYFSVCCAVPANKPPCLSAGCKTVFEDGIQVTRANKEAENGSLGSWRCGKCNKPCAVNRQKNGVDKEAA